MSEEERTAVIETSEESNFNSENFSKVGGDKIPGIELQSEVSTSRPTGGLVEEIEDQDSSAENNVGEKKEEETDDIWVWGDDEYDQGSDENPAVTNVASSERHSTGQEQGSIIDQNGENQRAQAQESNSWTEIGKGLGLGSEISSYDDLRKSVETLQARASMTQPDQGIQAAKAMLSLPQREFMVETLKLRGFDEEKAYRFVENLEANGQLEFEEEKARMDQKNWINNAENNLQQQSLKEERDRIAYYEKLKEDVRAAANSLQEVLGGRVKDQQSRNSTFEDIISGNFAKDMQDPKNLVEMNYIWRNREKLSKILLNKGVEKGKEMLINRMTHADLGIRDRSRPATKSEGFDVRRFTDLNPGKIPGSDYRK